MNLLKFFIGVNLGNSVCSVKISIKAHLERIEFCRMYQNALNSADYPALYQVWPKKFIFHFKNFNEIIVYKIIFSIAKWKRDRFTEESKNKWRKPKIWMNRRVFSCQKLSLLRNSCLFSACSESCRFSNLSLLRKFVFIKHLLLWTWISK